MESSGRIEKMKGYEGYYKARFGNFRVGVFKQGNIIVIKTVLNRKDIYNYFP
jgi:mRNA interferase RelE/StbE